MSIKRFHLMFSLVCLTSIYFLSYSFSRAGVDQYSKLDEFDNWLIERKIDSKKDQIFCRASMPEYGPWFGSRIRLDKDEELVFPEQLKVFKIPQSFPLLKIRNALKKCRQSLIYFPEP